MIELAVTVVLLLALSFLCSVLESVILSLTRPYIQTLIERRHRAGKALRDLKERIEEPITAILTLNTISHTVGAAVSGALALELFGSKWMAVFSAVLTFLILVFSEIIPKTVGARHWKALAPPSAWVLQVMILLMKPVVWIIRLSTRALAGSSPSDTVTREEILNFIRLGHFQGLVATEEFRIVENLFRLKNVKVSEVMTPVAVVFHLPPDATVGSLVEKAASMHFSRIPLIAAADGAVRGVVLRRDIMNRLACDDFDDRLDTFAQPAVTVPEGMSVYHLLNRMVEKKVHLATVTGDDGKLSGIVTLEDAMETLIGREIVDEFDPAVDMRALAKDLPAPAPPAGGEAEGAEESRER